jgi:predicted RNase H-like nuclease
VSHPSGVGVDGCRGGWFFFSGQDDGFRWGLAAGFSELLDQTPPGSPVLVDIPIGLTGRECPVRPCDTLARRRLGPRAASVFPTPSRAALECADYASASERNRQVTGRKLSRQTWNLMDKIREVDEVLANRPDARQTVRESHPEVCFAALAGGRPMCHYKKTDSGFEERVEILCACWSDSRRLLAETMDSLSRVEAARDDLVDALALAITASLDDGELETLPTDPDHDEAGRLMAITAPRWPS